VIGSPCIGRGVSPCCVIRPAGTQSSLIQESCLSRLRMRIGIRLRLTPGSPPERRPVAVAALASSTRASRQADDASPGALELLAWTRRRGASPATLSGRAAVWPALEWPGVCDRAGWNPAGFAANGPRGMTASGAGPLAESAASVWYSCRERFRVPFRVPVETGIPRRGRCPGSGRIIPSDGLPDRYG
jgi:hypothetical protein